MGFTRVIPAVRMPESHLHQPRHVNEGKQSWGYTCAVASRDHVCGNCPFLMSQSQRDPLGTCRWNPSDYLLLQEKWTLLLGTNIAEKYRNRT